MGGSTINYIVECFLKGSASGLCGGALCWLTGWSISQLVHFFKTVSR